MASETSPGSHLPLQHALADEHFVPGPLQDPAARQTPALHRAAQQSELAPQAAPFPRHVGEVGSEAQPASSLVGPGLPVSSWVPASSTDASSGALSAGASKRMPASEEPGGVEASNEEMGISMSSRPHPLLPRGMSASRATVAVLIGSSTRSTSLPGSRAEMDRRRRSPPPASAGSGAIRAPRSRSTRKRRRSRASRG